MCICLLLFCFLSFMLAYLSIFSYSVFLFFNHLYLLFYFLLPLLTCSSSLFLPLTLPSPPLFSPPLPLTPVTTLTPSHPSLFPSLSLSSHTRYENVGSAITFTMCLYTIGEQPLTFGNVSTVPYVPLYKQSYEYVYAYMYMYICIC